MNRKGFTLIELILVIAILGILAVAALPRFMNLTGDAERASRDGVTGAVRSGIALYRANDMITNGGNGAYPTTLDSNGNTACTTCFGTILTNAVNDASWTKSNLIYTFNDGTSTFNYTYNTTTGAFE